MLNKKMLRDMGRHKSQFVSIFLMAFLAVFIYAGVGGEWRGLRQSADGFYRQTNLADVWLYGSEFTDAQAQAALGVDGVTAVERRLNLDAVADFENAPVLSLYFVEKNEISTPYISEGAPFDADDAGGVWLAERFADAHGVRPGDALNVTLNGMPVSKTVRGLVLSPEQVFLSAADTLTPDFGAYGYAYLSYRAFPVPELLQYSTLLIKADSADTAELENKISAALYGKYSVFLEQGNHPSVSMFHNEILQHKMMGDIFPVVFLLIALLTMMTTMTRIVTGQRIQVGTLKALGFKKSDVTRHYISYGFFLSLAGAAGGLMIGPLILPPLFFPAMSGFYTLPEWKTAFDPAFLWVALLTVGLSAFTTYLTCRRLLRDTPADTLRPKAPKVFRHGVLERTRLWRRFGFNAQWNVRDASRNRVRSLMAIVGVFGCTALVVCALGMNRSMDDLKVWQYETISRYASKLFLDESVTELQLEAIVRGVHGEQLMEGGVEIRAGGVKRAGALTVTDNVTLIAPTDAQLKPMTLPEDGVALTLKMAKALNVGKGDEIEWHVYGSEGWIKSVVAEVYREPVSQGVAMTRAHFEALGLRFRATGVLSAETVTERFDGAASVLSTAESAAGWDDLTEAMYIMVFLLLAAAAVLSVVVLYNLGLLSFTEMEREMATLKVIGLKSGKLRGLLLTQNLWFSVAGFALGVPAGVELIEIIVSFSGESFDFPVALQISTLLVSFVFTFGLSVLVNLLFSRKIRGLNMVESLKAME